MKRRAPNKPTSRTSRNTEHAPKKPRTAGAANMPASAIRPLAVTPQYQQRRGQANKQNMPPPCPAHSAESQRQLLSAIYDDEYGEPHKTSTGNDSHHQDGDENDAWMSTLSNGSMMGPPTANHVNWNGGHTDHARSQYAVDARGSNASNGGNHGNGTHRSSLTAHAFEDDVKKRVAVVATASSSSAASNKREGKKPAAARHEDERSKDKDKDNGAAKRPQVTTDDEFAGSTKSRVLSLMPAVQATPQIIREALEFAPVFYQFASCLTGQRKTARCLVSTTYSVLSRPLAHATSDHDRSTHTRLQQLMHSFHRRAFRWKDVQDHLEEAFGIKRQRKQQEHHNNVDRGCLIAFRVNDYLSLAAEAAAAVAGGKATLSSSRMSPPSTEPAAVSGDENGSGGDSSDIQHSGGDGVENNLTTTTCHSSAASTCVPPSRGTLVQQQRRRDDQRQQQDDMMAVRKKKGACNTMLTKALLPDSLVFAHEFIVIAKVPTASHQALLYDHASICLPEVDRQQLTTSWPADATAYNREKQIQLHHTLLDEKSQAASLPHSLSSSSVLLAAHRRGEKQQQERPQHIRSSSAGMRGQHSNWKHVNNPPSTSYHHTTPTTNTAMPALTRDEKLLLYAANCAALHGVLCLKKKEAPPGYICYNCQQEGHYRSDCPLLVDSNGNSIHTGSSAISGLGGRGSETVGIKRQLPKGIPQKHTASRDRRRSQDT